MTPTMLFKTSVTVTNFLFVYSFVSRVCLSDSMAVINV